MGTKSFISTLDVFKSIPPHEMGEIEKKMVEKKYAKGESLFLEGDPAEYVWFVKQGHVKAVIHSLGGKDMTLCMMGANSLFGTCCCFGGAEYPCNSIAETEATVVSYPMKDFLALLGRYPEMSKAVVLQLSKRLGQAKEMQAFDQESVEKRILHLLLNLVAEFGNTIPLTRREIAEMVGTSVETCVRTFVNLEKGGLVSSTRGRIMVRNIQDLAARSGE